MFATARELLRFAGSYSRIACVFLSLLLLAVGGCGQKGALYLPDDYERPTYTKQVNESFDTTESFVQEAFDKVLFFRDAGDTTSDAAVNADNQPTNPPETNQ